MKKIISMILVFVMILSFMPIGALPAYAENEENSIQEIDQEVVNDTTPVENTNDQNLETNLGQTEGQELGEQTPGQEISEELDNLTENGDNQETEVIISEPTQEQEQQAGENDAQGDAEEPVFVYFALTPADATVTVYTVDEENPEESQIVEPQDDPYLYLLQPACTAILLKQQGTMISQSLFSMSSPLTILTSLKERWRETSPLCSKTSLSLWYLHSPFRSKRVGKGWLRFHLLYLRTWTRVG